MPTIYKMKKLPSKVEDEFRKDACVKVFFPEMTINAHRLWTGLCQTYPRRVSPVAQLAPCNRSVFELNWDSQGQVWQIPYPEMEVIGKSQKTLKKAVKEVSSLIKKHNFHLTELGEARAVACSIPDQKLI